MFFNATVPGFDAIAYLATLVPLLTSSNPNATIQAMAISQIHQFCNNSTLTPEITCDEGFVFDPLTGLCFISLNGTRNFWQGNEDCVKQGSELVGLDNDIKVKGILKLLNEGNISLTYSINKILVDLKCTYVTRNSGNQAFPEILKHF